MCVWRGVRRYLRNLYFPLHFSVSLKLFLKKTKSLVEEVGEKDNPWLRSVCHVGLLCVPVPPETISKVSLSLPLQCVFTAPACPLHTQRCYVGAATRREDLPPLCTLPLSQMSRAVHQTCVPSAGAGNPECLTLQTPLFTLHHLGQPHPRCFIYLSVPGLQVKLECVLMSPGGLAKTVSWVPGLEILI